MSYMPQMVEFLPGAPAAPINLEFTPDASGRTLTGTPNRDDVTKAVGQQIASEKYAALKNANTVKPTKPISAVTNPKDYHEQKLARYARTRNAMPQVGRASILRIEAKQAQHTPKATMAEVQKRMATQPQTMPKAKTVEMPQQMRAAHAPRNQMRRIMSTGARTGAEILAEALMPGAGIASAVAQVAFGRRNDPRARQMPGRPQLGIAQRMRRLGADLPEYRIG